MSLTGASSLKSLLHDLVESLQHKLDKIALSERKLSDFLLIPKDRSFEFANRYPVLEDSGIYLLAPSIAPEKHDGPPKDWDKDGTFAQFSAGSEVSALRTFFQTATDGKGGNRKRRGKAKADGTKNALPPAPPDSLSRKFGPVPLVEAESGDYLAAMLKARGQSEQYHRWAVGAGDRCYWKGSPVTTRTVEGDDVGVEEFLGPLAQAFKFIESGDEAGLRKLVEAQKVEADALVKDEKATKKAVAGTSDLRRYTVNVAPALARAMSLLLEQGVNKEKVRDLMVAAAPLVAAEFERVTGRKSVGVSIHFDSNLPHFNIWHTGLEPVIYKVGKSERTRFRRTAMDLNASGNMLAWDRVSRAFARVGEDFSDVSVATAGELKKAEERAQKRQGRPPGDFTINRKADEVLESALKELGYGKLIDRAYREFVVNERKRYAAAIAGRDGKDLKKIIDLLPQGPGESPLDATRRIVAERTKIEETLGPVHTDGENANLVSAIKNLVETATVAQSNEERMREALQAADGESLVDAAARVAALAEKPPVEKIVEREIVKEIVKEVVPQKLIDDHAAALSERDEKVRALAGELRATGELVELGQHLKERMEGHESKDKWDKGGSLPERARGFLDWFENEPKHLMKKFRMLVSPLSDFIRGYPAGEKLLKFVGIGKSK